ncbi:MAG: efflux RND transporter permease subunit [Negativicutes bacterium]|nr:efflux RND transporter permease subunit [Negativicutes bacterium]
MSISALWIRRPVMTTLVMLAIAVFGVVGYRQLPINDLPSVDYPVIQVNATLAGASAETMATTVAMPLEKEFTKIDGLQSMFSRSSEGMTTITLSFDFGRDIDAAAQDVNTAIASAQGNLPSAMTTPPSYHKYNPAEQPIMYFALTSDSMKLSKVQDYGETFISNYLSTISGVSKVEVLGPQKYAVRIKIDPRRLQAKNLTIDQVAAAVGRGSVVLPSGTLYGDYETLTIDAQGQLTNAAGYNDLIIATVDGRPVHLSDVGTAYDGIDYEHLRLWVWAEGKQYDAIVMAVSKQPGANAVKIADAVRQKLPELRAQLPAAVKIIPVYDQSMFIRQSITDVQLTLLLTIAVVVLVVLLFLRAFTPTIIPAVAVPLSLVATFAVMALSGFSLNNLSMMAMVLSVGFVVDDAIVMMENIVRRMEQLGETAEQAALSGSKEIGATIVSMTLSLAVVFVPILFMGGIIGALFREFAVTIAVAILLSGFISLTLTPMMCARILRPSAGHGSNWLFGRAERALAAGQAFYRRSLWWVLRHKLAAVAVIVCLTGGTVVLFMLLHAGFIPSEDTNFYMVKTTTADRSSDSYTAAHQLEINRMVQSDPNTRAMFAVAGYPDTSGGFMIAVLKDRAQRHQSVDEIIDYMRGPLNSVPGIQAFAFNPPPIQMGGRQTFAKGIFTLVSADFQTLKTNAVQFEQKLRQLPTVTDVDSDLKLTKPKLAVSINREKAYRLGVNVSDIETAFYSAFGSRSAATIYGSTNTYDVYIEFDSKFASDDRDLDQIYVPGSGGRLVPLNTIATIRREQMPLTVNHSGQIPSATISFNPRPGVALETAMKDIERLAKQVLPDTVSYKFEGNAEAGQSAFFNLLFLFVVTVFVIYVVLGILYESFIHPLTILTALPLAVFGALFSLFVFGKELNIYAMIGVVMLVGLVMKNGIMMVDFALENQREGEEDPERAIHNACMVRFRPILMTSLAAILGSVPIALGLGAGGDSRQPMGIAVAGGLVFSQLLTLYITPIFYVYCHRLRSRWLAGRTRGRSASPVK